MGDLKVTILLLVALAFSLAWNLRPLATPSQTGTGESVEAFPPASLPVKQRPGYKRPREHRVFHLQATRSLENRRLHDLKLFHLFKENSLDFSLMGMGEAYAMGLVDENRMEELKNATELEQLASAREQSFKIRHQKFLLLEDYILDTDFTELSEEEQDTVYRYYELRRRADEAMTTYYDIPMEEWVELARQCQTLRAEVRKLLERQYRHDVGEMSVEEALWQVRPSISFISAGNLNQAGRRVRVEATLPRTVMSDFFDVR